MTTGEADMGVIDDVRAGSSDSIEGMGGEEEGSISISVATRMKMRRRGIENFLFFRNFGSYKAGKVS